MKIDLQKHLDCGKVLVVKITPIVFCVICTVLGDILLGPVGGLFGVLAGAAFGAFILVLCKAYSDFKSTKLAIALSTGVTLILMAGMLAFYGLIALLKYLLPLDIFLVILAVSSIVFLTLCLWHTCVDIHQTCKLKRKQKENQQ